MIQFRELTRLSGEELKRLLRRAETDIRFLLPQVQEVVDRVRAEGDAALVDYTRRWDCAEFEATWLRASTQDFAAARSKVSTEVIAAMEAAHANIQSFHQQQMPEEMWFSELQPGVMAGEKVTPGRQRRAVCAARQGRISIGHADAGDTGEGGRRATAGRRVATGAGREGRRRDAGGGGDLRR